jgi:hypothetical protein
VIEWAAFFIAPVVAAVQIGVGYALVKPACATGGPGMLMTLSAAMAVAVAVGAVLGWTRRERFVGLVAIGLNILVMVLVIATTIPHFVLDPCR